MLAPPDPLLDVRAHAFLRERVIDAGERVARELTIEQGGAILAATSAVGRRGKSRRDVYVGHKLMELEACGLPAARACAIAPWYARGRPTPRPTTDGLSADQRDRRIVKCRALDDELREADLEPAPWPRSPSQAEREAFSRRERAWRQAAAERSLSVGFELSYDDLAKPLAVAVIVACILKAETAPSGYGEVERELRTALSRMRSYPAGSPPVEDYRRLLQFARGKPEPPHTALERLVAFTPAAGRAAERAMSTRLAGP